MAMVIISATEGSVDRTVNCMCTPSESANLHRTSASAPPRNTPGKIRSNKQIVRNLSSTLFRCIALHRSSIENLQFLSSSSLFAAHSSGLVNLRRHALSFFFLAPLIVAHRQLKSLHIISQGSPISSPVSISLPDCLPGK